MRPSGSSRFSSSDTDWRPDRGDRALLGQQLHVDLGRARRREQQQAGGRHRRDVRDDDAREAWVTGSTDMPSGMSPSDAVWSADTAIRPVRATTWIGGHRLVGRQGRELHDAARQCPDDDAGARRRHDLAVGAVDEEVDLGGTVVVVDEEHLGAAPDGRGPAQDPSVGDRPHAGRCGEAAARADTGPRDAGPRRTLRPTSRWRGPCLGAAGLVSMTFLTTSPGRSITCGASSDFLARVGERGAAVRPRRAPARLRR